ncbi:ankyrin repeat domain-containing protein SOWAHB isoform X2 [Aricia agestis]|uniref:ankyrin repeat domain-containing protein SOWAHB isoform X2 n=1 Tax=Aricia agestis TaxID=91739 RepID=UPI001C20A4F5|nr:ankyrin repeat domain-containing protein SOWAHB isoform X2 [Aricia agestis]
MSAPAELNFEEILKFMLAHNGKVTNHELVKHFKVFLMNPEMRDEARNTFKKHVNTLAIIKNQNNEKWLILKRKYMPAGGKENEEEEKKPEPQASEVREPEPYKPPPPLQLNQDFNILNNIIQDTKPSSPVVSTPTDINYNVSKESLIVGDEPPKIPSRRKSLDKFQPEKRSSIPQISPIINDDDKPNDTPPPLTTSKSEGMLVDNEQKISVKERKQMFNRMASESDVIKSNKLSFNNSNADEEDRASLEQKENDPLDSKQKQWILCAARGEYHSLAKMCKENPKLVRTKDPFTGTAMHWACKRGDENLVKLLAGVHRHVVNERSNGGYTPLHIAMQFRHENVFKLLVDVYDADQNVRDWSGRKPRQYLVHLDTSLSPGSYRKTETLTLRRTVTAPPVVQTPVSPTRLAHSFSKKEGFLRIGSLNVRVKRTTEAFSNFLGVGATRSSAYVPKTRDQRDEDQLHKSWGSADNIPKEDKLMPPPSSKVRRRGGGARRGGASRSTPSTPDQPRAQIGGGVEGDSDSDTAAGFHAAWRQSHS